MRGGFVAGGSIGHMPSSHAGTHTSFALDVMMNRGCRCGSRKFPFAPLHVDELSELRCDKNDGGQRLQSILLAILYNALSLNA